MKITYSGTLVELVPETKDEVKDLGQLWDLLVDCAKFNRKLVPVGEFVANDASRSKLARFSIEDK